MHVQWALYIPTSSPALSFGSRGYRMQSPARQDPPGMEGKKPSARQPFSYFLNLSRIKGFFIIACCTSPIAIFLDVPFLIKIIPAVWFQKKSFTFHETNKQKKTLCLEWAILLSSILSGFISKDISDNEGFGLLYSTFPIKFATRHLTVQLLLNRI